MCRAAKDAGPQTIRTGVPIGRGASGWKTLTGRKPTNTLTDLVIHPWMLTINAGEVQVVKDLLRYAKEEGAWFATVAGPIDLAESN